MCYLNSSQRRLLHARGPACMTDEEDIKGPEKRYLSESRRCVTNCAAAGQKYHLSEADKCANEGLGRRRDL